MNVPRLERVARTLAHLDHLDILLPRPITKGDVAICRGRFRCFGLWLLRDFLLSLFFVLFQLSPAILNDLLFLANVCLRYFVLSEILLEDQELHFQLLDFILQSIDLAFDQLVLPEAGLVQVEKFARQHVLNLLVKLLHAVEVFLKQSSLFANVGHFCNRCFD